MMYTVNKEFKITEFNKNFEKTFLDKLGIVITNGMDFMAIMQPLLRTQLFNNLLEIFKMALNDQPQHFEGKIKNKFGKDVWVDTFLYPIKIKNEKIEEISALAIDITDKKQVEKTLKNSLEEKEVLLKEIHHRVKNNLQVICSILNLQTSHMQDERVVEMLNESQNRIKSMSLIHEKLYQSKNFTDINFSRICRQFDSKHSSLL